MCSGARKTAPVPTALDVPVPPPRLVEPLDVEAPPPARLPEEPARPVPAHRRPAVPTGREPPKTEGLRPEPPAADVPKAAEEAPKPAPPPTTLQTTPAGAEGEVERSIRTTLARAATDLSRVDYRVLNADARTASMTGTAKVHPASREKTRRNRKTSCSPETSPRKLRPWRLSWPDDDLDIARIVRRKSALSAAHWTTPSNLRLRGGRKPSSPSSPNCPHLASDLKAGHHI